MAGTFDEKVSTQTQLERESQSKPETFVVSTTLESIIREFSGAVVARQRAELSSRLTAKAAEVLVAVGDNVQQGDILIRLESDDLDARVEQAEQSLSGAQARLNAARKDFSRVKELLSRKLVSQSQFDQSESQLQSANASFKQAKAAMSEAQTTLGYSMISAPFDGVITQKHINAGDMAAPGMPLLALYNPDSLQVEVNIAESVLPYIQLGSVLDVELPTNSIRTTSNVIEITPAADMGSRSYRIKLELTAQEKLYPGMYAKAKVAVGQQSLIRIPMDSFYQIGQLNYVKVWDGEMVIRRLIQLGENGRVRKGLRAGEEVLQTPL
jgi:RND family efflux transporter MFP subunit